LNFARQSNELWCAGGEVGFIQRMMVESVDYKSQVKWFTSLVSKKESLKPLKKLLNALNVESFTTINMTQGSKVSRFIT
jgi:23S rRNA (adenine1618-N6)-methyltransferase